MSLTRSRDDVVVAGVLAGLGDYFSIDPTLLRIGFVILAFIGVGAVIPIYIVAAMIIPKAPKVGERERERERERGSFDSRDRRHPRDRRDPRERRRRRDHRDFDRPRRPDMRQANKEDFSKRAKDVEEDDWSDF